MNPAHFSVWLVLTALPISAGGVYFTDRGASQLRRMGFDGTGPVTIVLSGTISSPGSNIRGLAVDTIADRLFWADNGADRLLRANLDGSASLILHTITGGGSFPADVRLDHANGHFYWCDQMRNRIQRSALDGTSVVDVVTGAAPTGPYFMELDKPAGKIYWGDFDGGSIFRSNLDGSSRETLITGLNMTRGICLDRVERMLYFVNRDDKRIHRCPLAAVAGGPLPVSDPAVETLYTGLDTPHGLVIDVPARKLYWADTGSNAGTGTGDRAVSRGDFDGSGPIEVLVTGSEPWDVDLDRRCASYPEWTRRCFPRSVPPVIPPPDGDPDNDGVVNALEYAFDSPPFHPGTSILPESFLTVGPVTNGVYHALRYRRRSDTNDLAYYVQVSTDMVTWQDDENSGGDPKIVETDVQPLGDGMEEVTARTFYSIDGLSRHFVRLRVVTTL